MPPDATGLAGRELISLSVNSASLISNRALISIMISEYFYAMVYGLL